MQISMTPNTNKKQLQQPSTMASTNTISMNIPSHPTTPNRIIRSILPKPQAITPINQVHQQITQANNVIPQPNIIRPSINQANGVQAIQAPQVHYAMPTTAKGNSLGFNTGLLNSVLKNIATRQNANYVQQAQKAQMNMQNQALNRKAQHNNLVSRLASLSKENTLNRANDMSITNKNIAFKNQIANLNYDAKMQQQNKQLTPYQTAMIKQNRLRSIDKALMGTYSADEISAISDNPQVKSQILQHYMQTGTMPKINYQHHYLGSNDLSIANQQQTQTSQQPQNTLNVTQLPIQQQYQIFKQQRQQQTNQVI